MIEKPTLKRTIDLPLLIFYGTGTMVGGIYPLLGKVAGQAGPRDPFADRDVTPANAVITGQVLRVIAIEEIVEGGGKVGPPARARAAASSGWR